MSKGNARISGAGSIAGGEYTSVVVSGSGRVTGELDCDELRVSGTLVCEGPVKARQIKVSGTIDFLGDVATESATVSGSSTFHAALRADRLKVSGSTEVTGALTGGTVDLTGGLKVGGDCEVERFEAVGGFSIGGLLSADTISVKMHGPCRVGEIGGGSIEFREGYRAWGDFAAALGLVGRKGLEATSVEGDHVLLERAKVDTVRGRDVTLGKGCEVGLVEYSGEFKHAGGARVKTARKTEAA